MAVCGNPLSWSLFGAKRTQRTPEKAPSKLSHEISVASRAMGRNLIVIDVSDDQSIEAAFNTLTERGAGGLLVGSGPFMNSHREKLIALAAHHSLPATYTTREAALAGGLMSYGTSLTDAWRQAGMYAVRLLKGDKTGDLPVLQATKFEFIINLKTAKTLGLSVPISHRALLMRSSNSQDADVRFWPKADIPVCIAHVCFWG